MFSGSIVRGEIGPYLGQGGPLRRTLTIAWSRHVYPGPHAVTERAAGGLMSLGPDK